MSAQPKAVMPRPYSGYQLRNVPPEDPEVTHTDPGTPMGELMRRFWQPVCLASELTDVPLALRILGEDLVAFRDKRGRVGVEIPLFDPEPVPAVLGVLGVVLLGEFGGAHA